MASLLALSTAQAGGRDSSLADAVKAAYLDKLGDFVSWPASAFSSPADPLHLCVAGTDPFGPLLDQAVEGQRIGGHPILVVRLDHMERGMACQILFVSGSLRQGVADALDKVRGAPVLTVTDGASDAGTRGMVNFVLRDNRVRFEIDEISASQSGLMISSKLLSLAVPREG
jgi:hypothetical protein